VAQPTAVLDEESIRIEEYDRVAVITFNRPERLNAWDASMGQSIERYLRALDGGEYRIRCVVLTGAGRAFCAGGNVKTFPGADLGRARPPWRPAHTEANITTWMRRADVPIIAAINGFCMGMGIGIALGADLRIAAEDALFQVAQMRRGLAVDYSEPYALPRVVGMQRALELMFTARRFTAQQALDYGLVLEVVPAARLRERALELASTIAAGPPLALAGTKQLAYSVEHEGLERVLQLTTPMVGLIARTEDAVEGVRAFLERRQPTFRGR